MTTKKQKDSHATMLVTMVTNTGVELFMSKDGKPHLSLPRTSEMGERTMPINSKAFKQWLSRSFYVEQNIVPTGSALADAVTALSGSCLNKPVLDVYQRIAGFEDEVFLDLGDAQHTIIHITKDGWGVALGATPKFIRKAGMLALPMPISTPGTEIEGLMKQFLNVKVERDVRMVVAWVVCAIRGLKPFLILVVRGAAGTAKSTACLFIRDIFDPNIVSAARPPKDTRDLMIAAAAQYASSWDNISSLDPDMADNLCSLATGGGFRTRELTTDEDEKIFSLARPFILNGIGDFLSRSDLASRSVAVTLDAISDVDRLTEAEARARYAPLQPQLLGAFLNVVVAVLGSTIRPTLLPRMGEAAVVTARAEKALGWKPGSFNDAILENEKDLASTIRDNSPSYQALKKLTLPWAGQMDDLKLVFPSGWTARKIINAITRDDAALRLGGIHVTLPKGQDKRAALRNKTIYLVAATKDHAWEVADIVAQLAERAQEAADRASQKPLDFDAPVTSEPDDIPF